MTAVDPDSGWPKLLDPGPHSQLHHPIDKVLGSDSSKHALVDIAEMYRSAGNPLEAGFHGVEASIDAASGTSEATKTMKDEHDEIAPKLDGYQSAVEVNQKYLRQSRLDLSVEYEKVIAEKVEIEKAEGVLYAKSRLEVQPERDGQIQELLDRRVKNDQAMLELDAEQKRIDARQVQVDLVQKNIDDWRTTSPRSYSIEEMKSFQEKAKGDGEDAELDRRRSESHKEQAEQHLKDYQRDKQLQEDHRRRMEQQRQYTQGMGY